MWDQHSLALLLGTTDSRGFWRGFRCSYFLSPFYNLRQTNNSGEIATIFHPSICRADLLTRASWKRVPFIISFFVGEFWRGRSVHFEWNEKKPEGQKRKERNMDSKKQSNHSSVSSIFIHFAYCSRSLLTRITFYFQNSNKRS